VSVRISTRGRIANSNKGGVLATGGHLYMGVMAFAQPLTGTITASAALTGGVTSSDDGLTASITASTSLTGDLT